MYTIILAICLVLFGAQGEAHNVSQLLRTDDFISQNRDQHDRVLQNYDFELQKFKEYYLNRLEALYVKLDLLTATIKEVEERLDPLEIINDFTKQCVDKYRYSISSVDSAKNAFDNCVVKATLQVNNLLDAPQNTRNTLENYYKYSFEEEVNNCKTIANSTEYMSCLSSVVFKVNTYTNNNRKIFQQQLDAAECIAKANIKEALDCGYAVQSDTTSQIAEANVLINNCLLGNEECKPCIFECNDILVLTRYEMLVKIINNPLYHRIDKPKCLILQAPQS